MNKYTKILRKRMLEITSSFGIPAYESPIKIIKKKKKRIKKK